MQQPGASARILVLEDDDDLRSVLAEVLSDEGFDVTAVSRGEHAVQQAQAEAFDLIIADIRMEGMDGLDALEQTQKLQPGIGSLIVSGYSTEQETARAERLEVGAYINKPFKMDDLLRHIRSELAHRNQQETTLESSDFFRQMLDWSFSTTAQLIDDSGVAEGSLSQAGEFAEHVCQKLGLEPEICLSARWATLLSGTRSMPGVSLPSFIEGRNKTVPLLSNILAALHRSSHEDIPCTTRESQVVELCLSKHFPDAGSPKRASDKYEQEVLKAFEEVSATGVPADALPIEVRLGLRRSEARQRSLASLAAALERLGDDENARSAYASLSNDGVQDKERLEGLLGLARLAQVSNDADKARSHALQALEIAKSRGPNSLSFLGLEAALLLQQLSAQEAEEALQLVGRAAQTIAFDEGLALVRCALADLQSRELESTHVKALLSPVSGSRIARYVNWLFHFLFRRLSLAPDQCLAEVLGQTAGDFVVRFLHWFDESRADTATRLAVSKALLSTRHLPETIIIKLQEAPEPGIREIGNQLKARGQGKSAPQLLRVQSFGQPAIFSQGEQLPESIWKTRKIKYLFFLLASKWGRPVTEDYILEAFWPKDHTRNKKNLYWGTTNLRSLLKKLCPNFENPLSREHDALALVEDLPRWHDLEEFRRASNQGWKLIKSGDTEGSLRFLRSAAQLYTGPYLDGCYHDFALPLKSETEQAALDVNLKAAEILLDQNQDDAALEHSSMATELAPFRQDARALKMRCQIRLGQAAQAIDQFHEIEKILKQEYELEPSTELLELFHRARLGFSDA